MEKTKREEPQATNKGTAPVHTPVYSRAHTEIQNKTEEGRSLFPAAHRKEAGCFPDALSEALTKHFMSWVGTFQSQSVSFMGAVFLANCDTRRRDKSPLSTQGLLWKGIS